MLRPPRPASPVLLLAGFALLLPAPASGQDLDEILGGIKEFREIKERWEELEDRIDRERDREREAEAQRRNVPDVRPAPPPGAGPGPAPGGGLYGPNGPGRPGAYAETGPGMYGPGAYGPVSPYETGPPYGPSGAAGAGAGGFVAADPPGAADADVYVMRNPALQVARYRIDGLPGGAIVVEPRDERAGGGFDRNAATAARDAASAEQTARRTLRALDDKLQDLRFALRRSGREFPGGAGAAQALSRRADDAAAATVALAEAFRPEHVAFASTAELDGFGNGGDAVRLATWSDGEYDRLEQQFRAFEATVPRLAADLGSADPYLRQRAAEVDRLHLAVDANFERLRAARERMRRPGEPLAPGPSAGRPVGGEDRLRLFALAARLTERTADLVDAAAADPLLRLSSPAARGPEFDGAGPALLRGPEPNGGANDDPLRAAERVDAVAGMLAAALASGADGRTVSGADAEFEQVWSAWESASAAAVGRTGPTPAVQTAAAAVEEVHHALHAAAPAAPGGGNAGTRPSPAEAAAALERSAAAFARQAPQQDLSSLRGTGRREFLAAANGLSAAASYYAAVVRSSAVGSDAERRARSVLDAAGNEAGGGLQELARGRGAAAGLAQGLMADLANWRSAVR